MPTSYPANIDAIPDAPPGNVPLGASAPKHTEVHQKLADVANAIQQTLGENPQGAAASVAARLDGLPAAINLRGLLSARPAASAANAGFRYELTDAMKRMVARSDGAAWNEEPFCARDRNAINVKDAPFGAKGDGVTDDTAAFIAAIEHIKASRNLTDKLYVPASRIPATMALYVPAGNYKITQQLVVDFIGFRMFGDGKASSVLIQSWVLTTATEALLAFGVFDPVYVDPWHGENGSNFIVRGIGFYSSNNILWGRTEGNRLGCGIITSNSHNGVIDDCAFGWFGTGVLSAYGGWGTKYTHCDFERCDFGISLFDVDEVQVEFCQTMICGTGFELQSAHQIQLDHCYNVDTLRPVVCDETDAVTRIGTTCVTTVSNTIVIDNGWFEELPSGRHWTEAIKLTGVNSREIFAVYITNSWVATYNNTPVVNPSYFMTYSYCFDVHVKSVHFQGYATAYFNSPTTNYPATIEDMGPSDRWAPDTAYGFGFLPLFAQADPRIHFKAVRRHVDVLGPTNDAADAGYHFSNTYKNDPSAEASYDNKNRRVKMTVVDGPNGYAELLFRCFKRPLGGWAAPETVRLGLETGTVHLNGQAIGFWPSTSGTPTRTDLPAESKLWNSTYANGRTLGWSYSGGSWVELGVVTGLTANTIPYASSAIALANSALTISASTPYYSMYLYKSSGIAFLSRLYATGTTGATVGINGDARSLQAGLTIGNTLEGVRGTAAMQTTATGTVGVMSGVTSLVFASAVSPLTIKRASGFTFDATLGSGFSGAAHLAEEFACFYANPITAAMMANGASIRDHYGFLVNALTVGTNRYGLKCGDVSGGSLNYSIWTGLGEVRHGDVVRVVTATPAPAPAANEFTAGAGTARAYTAFYVGADQVVGARQAVGAAMAAGTVGGTYGATEQGLLQAAHDRIRTLETALRTHGLLKD